MPKFIFPIIGVKSNLTGKVMEADVFYVQVSGGSLVTGVLIEGNPAMYFLSALRPDLMKEIQDAAQNNCDGLKSEKV